MEEDSLEEDEEQENSEESTKVENEDEDQNNEDEDQNNEDEDQNEDEEDQKEMKFKKKKLSFEKVKKFNEEQERKGVIYLSRVPPYMKPTKMRYLMEQFGPVGKLYLAMEKPEIQKKRKKFGGNKNKSYTEGWVEFLDKRIAKQVALSLNNTLIGGPKNNYYRDDIWNMKYLSKFKWNDLTDKIAYDRMVRNKKLRQEIISRKKELEEYKRRVEQQKLGMKIEERKTARKLKLEKKYCVIHSNTKLKIKN